MMSGPDQWVRNLVRQSHRLVVLGNFLFVLKPHKRRGVIFLNVTLTFVRRTLIPFVRGLSQKMILVILNLLLLCVVWVIRLSGPRN